MGCGCWRLASLPPVSALALQEITELFAADCEALAQGAYDDWQASLYDCLAGILVGDQLSRNVWRGSARMFSNDVRVLAWAKALVVSCWPCPPAAALHPARSNLFLACSCSLRHRGRLPG